MAIGTLPTLLHHRESSTAVRTYARRFLPFVAIPLVYCAITAIMLLPLVAHLRTAVAETDADPLLNAWALQWVQHALVTNPLHLYDANMFAPNPRTLAFSEALIPQALLAWPVSLLTHDGLLTYNFSVLLTYPMCAVAMYALCRALGANRGASFVAGLCFAFAPFRMDSTAHLQVLSMQWMPLVLLAVIRFVQRPSWWRGATVTATLALCALSSVYYAVMFGVGLGVFLLIEAVRQREAFVSRTGVGLGVVLLLAVGIVAVLDRPYLQMRAEQGIVRTLDEAYDDSAHATSYLTAVPGSLIWSHLLPKSGTERSALFPGAVLSLLALVGLRRLRQPWMPGMVAMGIVAFVLSFGPTWGDKTDGTPLPYRLLYKYIVGFQGIRGPDRFVSVVLVALCAFAALGATWLWDAAVKHRLHLRHYALPVAAIVAGVVALDTGARLLPTISVDRSDTALAPYRWLATYDAAGIVAEFPADRAVRTTSFYSTYHWHPVLWGHSGFVPEAQYRLVNRFQNRPDRYPNPTDLDALTDMGVRTLVIHRDAYSSDDLAKLRAGLAKIPDRVMLRTSVGNCDIYGINPTAEPLPVIESVTLNASIEGNADTVAGQIRITNSSAYVRMLYTAGKPQLVAEIHDARGAQIGRYLLDIVLPAVVNPDETFVPFMVPLPGMPGTYTVTITAHDFDRFPAVPPAQIQVLNVRDLPRLKYDRQRVTSPPLYLADEPVAMWATLKNGRTVPLRDTVALPNQTLDAPLPTLPAGTQLIVAHGKTSGVELFVPVAP